MVELMEKRQVTGLGILSACALKPHKGIWTCLGKKYYLVAGFFFFYKSLHSCFITHILQFIEDIYALHMLAACQSHMAYSSHSQLILDPSAISTGESQHVFSGALHGEGMPLLVPFLLPGPLQSSPLHCAPISSTVHPQLSSFLVSPTPVHYQEPRLGKRERIMQVSCDLLPWQHSILTLKSLCWKLKHYNRLPFLSISLL